MPIVKTLKFLTELVNLSIEINTLKELGKIVLQKSALFSFDIFDCKVKKGN